MKRKSVTKMLVEGNDNDALRFLFCTSMAAAIGLHCADCAHNPELSMHSCDEAGSLSRKIYGSLALSTALRPSSGC
jgi:hypothetical protein